MGLIYEPQMCWRQWKSPEPLSAAVLDKHRYYIRPSLLFKNYLHAMSPNTAASILDEALVCIGQRIASALIQPTKQDETYITSLHNEVVGILIAEEHMDPS